MYVSDFSFTSSSYRAFRIVFPFSLSFLPPNTIKLLRWMQKWSGSFINLKHGRPHLSEHQQRRNRPRPTFRRQRLLSVSLSFAYFVVITPTFAVPFFSSSIVRFNLISTLDSPSHAPTLLLRPITAAAADERNANVPNSRGQRCKARNKMQTFFQDVFFFSFPSFPSNLPFPSAATSLT